MKEQIELKIDIPSGSDFETEKTATEFTIEVDPEPMKKESQ
jgi:hypothetical protein